MKRTPVMPDLNTIPEQFHSLLENRTVFDSSCSKEARVYYIETDGGLFLKAAPKGTLETEAKMNTYFHSLGLGAAVLSYQSGDMDWLLTRRVPGEDCIFPAYLENPKRLCDTLAEALVLLHSQDFSQCPVPNRTETYLNTVHRAHAGGDCELDLFPEGWGFPTPEAAWETVQQFEKYLKTDTLLHGDYCLPNVMLDNWKFSGFIDVGNGGVGDKHIDLFWGVWTLNYNLKTDKFCNRFLDAYGRENFEPELLRAIAAFELFGG